MPDSLHARERELDPIFEMGGPAFRFMQRIGIIKGAGPSILRRSAAFIAITWVPLLAFSAYEGLAIGPTPRSSFLLDFATYARFFIAVPLLFAAEVVVGPRLRRAGLRFLEGGLVREADHAAFHAAALRARRRRDAALPELIAVALALVGAWFVTIDQLGGLGTNTWHTLWTESGIRLAPAGIWYHAVAIPLVQFFLLRWLWRLAIWTMFLRDVSCLRLRLLPTHSDMAAGVGFLGMAHVSLAIFPFAMGCVLSADIAFRVQYEGFNITSFRSIAPLLIVYLLFVEIVTFGPLLLFVPVLARARRDALRSYGILVQQHNRLFHEKWIEGKRPADELPLGSGDMSSLIDLGDSFKVVRDMNVIPVGRGQLVQVAAVACLPGIPLLFIALPVVEVLRLVVGTVL